MSTATATARQLEANRANSLLSTGPTSSEGKQHSSQNALKHGLTSRNPIVAGEDPADYAEFVQNWFDVFKPKCAAEQILVEELAELRWRIRRIAPFEAHLFNAEIRKLQSDPELASKYGNAEPGQLIAFAFERLVASKVLPNLFNLESRLSRRIEKLEKHLYAIQAAERMNQLIRPTRPAAKIVEMEGEIGNLENEANFAKPQPIRVAPQPGRNESCPCGSGLKFKRCCMNRSCIDRS